MIAFDPCTTCNKKQFLFFLEELRPEGGAFYHSFCSIDCLLDWAWKQKESQPKLSKSKTGDHNTQASAYMDLLDVEDC